jgi:hypothetical protein
MLFHQGSRLLDVVGRAVDVALGHSPQGLSAEGDDALDVIVIGVARHEQVRGFAAAPPALEEAAQADHPEQGIARQRVGREAAGQLLEAHEGGLAVARLLVRQRPLLQRLGRPRAVRIEPIRPIESLGRLGRGTGGLSGRCLGKQLVDVAVTAGRDDLAGNYHRIAGRRRRRFRGLGSARRGPRPRGTSERPSSGHEWCKSHARSV